MSKKKDNGMPTTDAEVIEMTTERKPDPVRVPDSVVKRLKSMNEQLDKLRGQYQTLVESFMHVRNTALEMAGYDPATHDIMADGTIVERNQGSNE